MNQRSAQLVATRRSRDVSTILSTIFTVGLSNGGSRVCYVWPRISWMDKEVMGGGIGPEKKRSQEPNDQSSGRVRVAWSTRHRRTHTHGLTNFQRARRASFFRHRLSTGQEAPLVFLYNCASTWESRLRRLLASTRVRRVRWFQFGQWDTCGVSASDRRTGMYEYPTWTIVPRGTIDTNAGRRSDRKSRCECDPTLVLIPQP